MVHSIKEISRPISLDYGDLNTLPVDIIVEIAVRVLKNLEIKEIKQIKRLNKTFYWFYKDRKNYILRKSLEREAKLLEEVDSAWDNLITESNQKQRLSESITLLDLEPAVLEGFKKALIPLSKGEVNILSEIMDAIAKYDLEEEEVDHKKLHQKFFATLSPYVDRETKCIWIKRLISSPKNFYSEGSIGLFLEILWDLYREGVNPLTKEIDTLAHSLIKSIEEEEALLDDDLFRSFLDLTKIRILVALSLFLYSKSPEAYVNIEKAFAIDQKIDYSYDKRLREVYLKIAFFSLENEDRKSLIKKFPKKLSIDKYEPFSRFSKDKFLRRLLISLLESSHLEIKKCCDLQNLIINTLQALIQIPSAKTSVFAAKIFKEMGFQEKAISLSLAAIPLAGKLKDPAKRGATYREISQLF